MSGGALPTLAESAHEALRSLHKYPTPRATLTELAKDNSNQVRLRERQLRGLSSDDAEAVELLADAYRCTVKSKQLRSLLPWLALVNPALQPMWLQIVAQGSGPKRALATINKATS